MNTSSAPQPDKDQQAASSKTFLCKWHIPEYEHQERIHEIDFFSEYRGYEAKDYFGIDLLALGETYNFYSPFGTTHTVKRLS